MWTHIHPYLEYDGTANTVERTARVGLWRAINLGRLVLLTGSGVSMPYEKPTWRVALAKFVLATVDCYHERWLAGRGQIPPQRRPQRPTQLFAQLATLCKFKPDEKPAKADLVNLDHGTLEVALELCERLLGEIDSASPPPPNAMGAQDTVRVAFGRDYRVTPSPPPADERDSLDVLLSAMRSRRVLTTNYDVEIERTVAETVPEDDLARLIAPAGEGAEEEAPLPRRIERVPALGRSIVSNSLDAGNVGDLLNFAAYSRRHAMQVFHLHGRWDQHKDIVLTPNVWNGMQN